MGIHYAFLYFFVIYRLSQCWMFILNIVKVSNIEVNVFPVSRSWIMTQRATRIPRPRQVHPAVVSPYRVEGPILDSTQRLCGPTDKQRGQKEMYYDGFILAISSKSTFRLFLQFICFQDVWGSVFDMMTKPLTRNAKLVTATSHRGDASVSD